jgi:deoxyribonuclease V
MTSFPQLHPWDVTPGEAIAIQEKLRHSVIRTDDLGEVRSVAGVDVGFPELVVYETSVIRRPTSFPYVPGLLSFREAPAVLQALEQLGELPDLLLCDGQGLAHPRRFGIACHLGVLTGLPSIGVAKSILVGKHAPLEPVRGAWQPLLDRGEQVGAALCTRPEVRPVYISIGHRVSLETAVEYVLRCVTKYRLPETTRQAHHLAST